MDGDQRAAFDEATDGVVGHAVGRELGADVEVMAGVSAGEQVVVSAPEELSDGQPIRLRS